MNKYRPIIFPIISFICFYILFKTVNLNSFKKEEIVSTLISVISIIIAIIVTYLFSKLFAEKTIKIERKKEIDVLANKITYLRRIAFHIRGMFNFWKFDQTSIKSIIDNNFPDLTYEQFRSYEGHKKYEYEELMEIDEKIYGTDGQAYLALKGLEDGDSSFSFYSEFNPRNYTLDDIARFKDYAGSFWYFLDRSSDEIYSFDSEKRYWLENIDELYYKITNKPIDQSNYRKSIKDLLTEFDSIIFEKHYYLTSINESKKFDLFKSSFYNMSIFLTLLVLSIFVYMIDFTNLNSLLFTTILVSLFVANTLDLVLLTAYSIKSELNINEFYSV